jgi:iron(III) transport system substrate-binding protein
MDRRFRAFPVLFLAMAALFVPANADAQQRTRLTIYTATEVDQLATLKAAIEADHPDVEVAWVRDSTGVITARLIAERDRPRADMIFGIVTSSLLALERMNVLEPYRPQGVDQLKPQFRDPHEPYSWTGLDAFVVAVCFNTGEAAKLNLARPERWQDLARPEFRQRIVMPHPASSGTGFLLVSNWIQIMGEEAAWDFMEKLHRNVALYTHSGSAPCVQAARGERLVGLSFDMRGAREKTLGAPIDVIIPQDGVAWEMGGMAIIRGRPEAQAAAARRISDWAIGPKANELFARFYGIVARQGFGSPPNYPRDAESRMTPNNSEWMAANRDRILTEWTRRFDNPLASRN